MTTRSLSTHVAALKNPRKLPPHYLLLAAWVLSMVLLPIAKWVWGDGVIRWSVLVNTLLQFSAVMALLVQSWGWRRATVVFAVVALTSWLAEAVGTATGFPFGRYDYTDLLQPQFAHVPLVIPLAWMMMLPSAWAVASMVTARRDVFFVVVSAAAMTAWDLFLDPQMVGWGFWVWQDGGAYFGIPLINYAGWLLTAGVITALVRPRELPVFPLLLIYGVTSFLQSVGQFVFWSMPGPALFGTLGMGGMLLLAWWSHQRRQVNA